MADGGEDRITLADVVTADAAPNETADGAPTNDPDFAVIPGNPPPEGARAIWYQGRYGRRLRMMFAPAPKDGPPCRGTVFVLPGFSEFIEKYFEVARDLQSRAFAVVVLDWPGQGRSERQLKQHPERAHIRHYAEHVDALRLAVAAIGKEAPKPHLILAHSMGGCIALEAIARKRVEVAGAAFSAPMWGISIFFALRWLVRVLRLIGLGAMPLRGGVAIETFETNVVTNDRGRWQMQQDLFRADPRLKLGSPTVGWVVSSLRAIRGLFEHGLGPAERLPMLVALADDERVVNKSKEKALARRLREASVFTVDGAKHEILMETDARRAEFWKEFDRFCTRLKV